MLRHAVVIEVIPLRFEHSEVWCAKQQNAHHDLMYPAVML
jgi:hypothetical protein